MSKPTRTILTLVTGSLVLGLAGSATAVADQGPVRDQPAQQTAMRGGGDDEDGRGSDDYGKDRHARGIVVSNGPLTVRSKPSTHSRKLGTVHPHEKLDIVCKERGEDVRGNDIWYLLDRDDRGKDGGRDEDGRGGRDPIDQRDDEDGRQYPDQASGKKRSEHWVAARYVKNFSPVKWCRL
ncbi:hypothetical protein [Streptomyces sp. NPDC089919]|uniref:hypothetical protein n=1 Tax=Streptomyces sp. NPDC089919 TaxID=3155188 RepID=UPI003449D407